MPSKTPNAVRSRGLSTQTIHHFRGINAYTNIAELGPEWAQDCLNVIVSGSGNLSKMRTAQRITAPAFSGGGGDVIPAQVTGPDSFWDFQQGNGTRQVFAQFGQSVWYYPTLDPVISPILIESNPLNSGQWSFGIANNILFGANGQRMQKWTGVNWWQWGIVGPVAAPPLLFGAPGSGTLSPTTGYSYSYAYKNSVTGHCSNVSPVSPVGGAGIVGTVGVPTAAAPPDPQADTIVWFRTLDGGGDQFRLAEVNLVTGVVTFNSATVAIAGGTFNLQIQDQTPDANLDSTIRGPLINNIPVQGRYVAVGQNRAVVFNLIGAPQDFIYSGYEQILFGRPEECFPPNNRIKLSIGAEQIAGGGILQSGIVAFSQTGRMFMLRGLLEDITLNQPVSFSEYLEELPWQLGCLSHFAIAHTPFGLVWLAGDKTVQVFDGQSQPIDISANVYPLLRQITPGTESLCVAAYFNWLERDWYAVLCAVNGSLAINRIFFFALNKAAGAETLDSVETFISDIPAQSAGVTWIGLITTSKQQRKLCIGADGFIKELPVIADTVNGLNLDPTIIPATFDNLNAYWKGGYVGTDSPQRAKMFRWQRLLTDQDANLFKITNRLVDDVQNNFLNPYVIGPNVLSGPRYGVNRKAKRMSTEINFPQQDVSANVLELQTAFIPTSDR